MKEINGNVQENKNCVELKKNDRMKMSIHGEPYVSVCDQNPEGLILLPKDIYLAAKKLGMTTQDFYNKFCHVALQPSDYFWVGFKAVRKKCPFSCDGDCRIADAMPRLCASFPVLDLANPLDTSEHSYSQFLGSGPHCDAPYTVAEWLSRRGVDLEDPDTNRYYEALGKWMKTCAIYEVIQRHPVRLLDARLAIQTLYAAYDTSKDFSVQFAQNSKQFLEPLNRTVRKTLGMGKEFDLGDCGFVIR